MVEALGLSAWRWAATRTHVLKSQTAYYMEGWRPATAAALDQVPVHSALWCFDTALFNAVENNCGYHLFESDTEEEEEEVVENKEEEEAPKKKSAFQVRARKTPETRTTYKWKGYIPCFTYTQW